jgi:ferredoxin-NADP reductase
MPIIKKTRAIITSISNPIEGIYTVKMMPEKRIMFYPGQFLHLALEEYDGGQWPESRCFSMQNSPDDEEIKITFSVKGKFTSEMATRLSEGVKVWLKLPYGDIFLRKHNRKNCVFIAGGTGVTPFISLFRSQNFDEYENAKIYLGFRTNRYDIYKGDWEFIFNKLKSSHKFNFYYEDQDGILNIEKIFEDNAHESTFFISGPPLMIKNFKLYLINKNVEQERIITDDWE